MKMISVSLGAVERERERERERRALIKNNCKNIRNKKIAIKIYNW